MVVAAYGLILPAEVLSFPACGCLNIHASLLPRWRGAAPIQRAMLSGDTETGVCIMKMDEGLDTGDVIARATVEIEQDMTGGELHDVLAELGATTLLKSMPSYCSGQLQPVPQSEDGVTYAEKLSKAEARIDFSQSALSVHRKIQAFNPWPVAEAVLGDIRYRLWHSKLVAATSPQNAQPGQVVEISDRGIRVATGDGLIDILTIQKPGKKALSAVEFGRGTDLTGRVFD